MVPLSRWLLEFESGRRITLRAGVTVVGRSSNCDVVLDDPAVSRRQLLLLPRQDGVEIVNVGRQAASVDGQVFDEPALARSGTHLEIAGVAFGTIQAGDTAREQEASTVLGPRVASAPISLRLETYARGGLLTLSQGEEQRSCYLASLRFALLRGVLRPPAPAVPGDFVSVEGLCRQIWPEDPHKDDTDFGVLLYRLRQDLQRAGFEPDQLLERARGTGMIRAPLAREAAIVVE